MARPVSQGGIDYQDGGFATGVDVYPTIGDLGEIAARLKSPVNFDRRGTVFHIDDFEHGAARWTNELAVDQRKTLISATTSKTGGYALKLVPSSSVPYTHQVFCRIAYPRPSKIGIEIAFTVPEQAHYIEIHGSFYSGTELHYVKTQYDHVAHTFGYLNSGGGWTDLDSNVTLLTGDDLFHVVKFVIDMEDDVYHRALLDANRYEDIDGPIQTVENYTNPHLKMWLYIRANDDSQPAHYFDGLILTQNES